MRSRFIKPGFFKNEELAELPPIGRILFAGLWCIADKAGRLEDRPKRIKAEVLPYDDCDVEATLVELARRGFIERYQVGDARYIQVSHWKHQAPHHTETPSVIPPNGESTPDNVELTIDNGEFTVNPPLNNESTTRVLLDTDYLLPVTDNAVQEVDPPTPPPKKEPRAKSDTLKLTTFPSDFELTDVMREWALKDGCAEYLDLERETKEFIEYWSEGGGLGEKRKNWLWIWKTRMREQVERAKIYQRQASRGARTNGHRTGTNVQQLQDSDWWAAQAAAQDSARASPDG